MSFKMTNAKHTTLGSLYLFQTPLKQAKTAQTIKHGTVLALIR